MSLEQIRNAREFYAENEGKVTPARSAVTILTRVRIKGKTEDGRDVEIEQFLFPSDSAMDAAFSILLLSPCSAEDSCPVLPNVTPRRRDDECFRQHRTISGHSPGPMIHLSTVRHVRTAVDSFDSALPTPRIP